MFDCLDKKATQAGFARLVGVSKQAISARVSDGQMIDGGTYAEWLTSYLEGLRQEAAGRSEKQLGEIRGRKELAQAMREEYALAQEMGLVILAPDVEPALIGILKEVQSQVLQAGKKGLQSVQAEHAIQIDDSLILNPLRDALANVGSSGDQLVAALTEKPCGAVSKAINSDGAMDRGEHKTSG